jgi:hypothetical protein
LHVPSLAGRVEPWTNGSNKSLLSNTNSKVQTHEDDAGVAFATIDMIMIIQDNVQWIIIYVSNIRVVEWWGAALG